MELLKLTYREPGWGHDTRGRIMRLMADGERRTTSNIISDLGFTTGRDVLNALDGLYWEGLLEPFGSVWGLP